MKINCNVIKDLLPLCCEDIASKESKELVNEHCKECSECNSYFMSMREGEIVIEDNGRSLKNFIRECKRNTIALIAIFSYAILVLAAILVGIISKDMMGSAFLFVFRLFPIVGFFSGMVIATQKLPIKYIFPVVCGLVGVTYQNIVMMDFSNFEFLHLFFWPNFIAAVAGMITGVIRAKVGINENRRINAGMIAGIVIIAYAIWLYIYIGETYCLPIVLMICAVGIIVFNISFFLRKRARRNNEQKRL